MPATKLLFLMAIGITLAVTQSAPIDNPGNNTSLNNNVTCLASQCVLTASHIINDMDPTVDPCQDFSKFTCGGFVEKTKIPADADYITAMAIMYANVKDTLRSIFDPSLGNSPEAEPDDVAAQNNIRKLQDLFSSCMDEETILTAGSRPLVDEIQKTIHPLSASDSPANKTALAKTMALVARFGFGVTSFIYLHVGPDPRNPSVNVLNVGENGLGLWVADEYVKADIKQNYTEVAAAMFQLILGGENVSSVKKEWQDIAQAVFAFEYQIFYIRTRKHEMDNPTRNYNPRTVQELSILTPSIDWPLLLQEIFPGGYNDTLPLIIPNMVYLAKLDALLQKTPAKTLQYYFSWILIRNLGKHLSPPYKQPLTTLSNLAPPVFSDVGVDRGSICLGVVSYNLAHIASYYVAQRTLEGKAREEAVAILDNINTSYENNFHNVSWLDRESRDGAIKKIKSMVKLVGYSLNNPNATSSLSLNDFYKDYAVVADNYFANQVRYHLWSTAKNFAKLNLPFDREAMDRSPMKVYPITNDQANSITFGTGTLQMPYFHVENPEYVNYGGLGAMSGITFGYSFDDIGRNFDATGRRVNWWSNATSQAFVERSQCFVEQYRNFTVKGPGNKDYNVEGRATLRANIADNGSTKMAFQSWKKHFSSDPNGKKYKNFQLPGLEKYTPEQLFFISRSRSWCINRKLEFPMSGTHSNTVSPSQWRINGVAINSPDFARAFNCPVGSPMNPVKKCKVW